MKKLNEWKFFLCFVFLPFAYQANSVHDKILEVHLSSMNFSGHIWRGVEIDFWKFCPLSTHYLKFQFSEGGVISYIQQSFLNTFQDFEIIILDVKIILLFFYDHFAPIDSLIPIYNQVCQKLY